MLRVAFCLLLALMGAAAAQEPRIVMSVDLPAADGQPQSYAQRRALSVGPDGSFVAALERAALVTDAAGQLKTRIAFPDRKLVFVCAVAVAEDDFVLLFQNPAGSPQAGLALFHHGADGKLKRESVIPPPPGRTDPNAVYDVERCTATPDKALLLTGSHGSGPYTWWLGKIGLQGTAIFQANGRSFPERVAAAGMRPDGTVSALVQEIGPAGTDPLLWYMHRYIDGERGGHARLAIERGYAAAMLPTGGVITADEYGMFVVNDEGRVLRQSPWPFHRTGAMVGDDGGLWAVGSLGDHTPDWLVRVNQRGTLYHYRTRLNIAGIAGAPSEQLGALVVSDDRRTVRLVRFDGR